MKCKLHTLDFHILSHSQTARKMTKIHSINQTTKTTRYGCAIFSEFFNRKCQWQNSRGIAAHSILSMARMFLLFIIWVVLRFLKAKRWLTLYCWPRTLTTFIEPQKYTHKRRAQPTNAKYDCQLLLFVWIQAVALCMLYCEPQCITVIPNAQTFWDRPRKCTLVRCMIKMYTILVYKKKKIL